MFAVVDRVMTTVLATRPPPSEVAVRRRPLTEDRLRLWCKAGEALADGRPT
ncbi:MAG: hypothetical protein JJLCMIEE_02497 [Acidimicrobiales bacterium]|nr:hypothetical protein [Acidimicrobiales bacterium]